MHSHEFCYWLQGYFELRETGTALTKKQMDCIARHVELVKAVDKTQSGNFVHWIRGVIGTTVVIDRLEENKSKFENFSASITELIKAELANCFKHEIDNKYGIEGLDQIHHPTPNRPPIGPFNPDGTLRC